MKKLFLSVPNLLFLGLLPLLFSCNHEEIPGDSQQKAPSRTFIESKNGTFRYNIFKGPQVTLGKGKVRSWISVRSDGFPMELGIELTPVALMDLPNEAAAHSDHIIPLHLKARQATPFDHVGLNWNPSGHPPPGIFDPPHFDVHFYLMSLDDRMQIPEYSPHSDAAFNNYPPPGYMPTDYFTPPGADTAEAKMGKHWLPVNLGAFLPFTHIMILGTYNGMFTFIEPMVTLDYLNSGAEMSSSFSQPEFFQKSGNYPTMYNIYREPKNGHLFITLSGFVARN
jgi:hypothetical protein